MQEKIEHISLWFCPQQIGTFIGFAHREKIIYAYVQDLDLGWIFGSLIGQCGDDKCSHNENFHMDVIFHVWVDVTLSTLDF
jgi:hypothetical protein